VWPHHYTKRGGLCGCNITLRGEVCMAVSLHQEGMFVWPCHYIKRGGLCGCIITLRLEACVAASKH
jgi:hypothetical protein